MAQGNLFSQRRQCSGSWRSPSAPSFTESPGGRQSRRERHSYWSSASTIAEADGDKGVHGIDAAVLAGLVDGGR